MRFHWEKNLWCQILQAHWTDNSSQSAYLTIAVVVPWTEACNPPLKTPILSLILTEKIFAVIYFVFKALKYFPFEWNGNNIHEIDQNTFFWSLDNLYCSKKKWKLHFCFSEAIEQRDVVGFFPVRHDLGMCWLKFSFVTHLKGRKLGPQVSFTFYQTVLQVLRLLVWVTISEIIKKSL